MFEVLFVSLEPFLSDYPMKLVMGIRHADLDMQLFEYLPQFDALGFVEPGFVEFACFWFNLPDELPEESERAERLVIRTIIPLGLVPDFTWEQLYDHPVSQVIDAFDKPTRHHLPPSRNF